MKTKSSFVILLFFICGLCTQIKAQKTLNLKSKSGTITSYSISTIKTLTFSAGNMSVNKKDLTTHPFVISALRQLYFSNYPNSIADINENVNTKLSLYPVPAVDVLTVQFSLKSAEKMNIQMIDLQGKTVYQQRVDGQMGINNQIINVSALHHGLYFLRLKSETKNETAKFLKN